MNEKQQFNWIMLRLKLEDLDLLHLLRDNGAMDKRTIRRRLTGLFQHNPDETVNTFRRCKSYGLIKVVRRGTNFLYAISDRGLNFILKYDAEARGERPLAETV